MMDKIVWLQISAGNGPKECHLAVVRVVRAVQTEPCSVEVLQATDASALLALTGPSAQQVADAWTGTVLCRGQSPMRAKRSRKNYYVGVTQWSPPADGVFAKHEVVFQTMRASGPGGQHVNKTESAVRAIHVPTGLVAVAQEERSQHRNRALALSRLYSAYQGQVARHQQQAETNRWRAHHQVERGNPIRRLEGLEENTGKSP